MTELQQARKILIVDDDERLRQIVRTTLGTEFDIEEASTGPEAIAATRTYHPDLILLDVNMPGVDGFRVCQTLKSDATTADIPVVMLTGRGRRVDIQIGKDSGADAFIVKPFSPSGLLTKIFEILKKTCVTVSKPCETKI